MADASNTRKRYLCTCTACRAQTEVDVFGQILSGRYVPYSTRRYHLKNDLTNPAATIYRQNAEIQVTITPNLSGQRAPLASSISEGADLTGPAPQADSSAISDPEGADLSADCGPEEPGIATFKESIYVLACCLFSWLHLVCGLSRDSSSKALKVLDVIVQLAIKLGIAFSSLALGRSSRSGKTVSNSSFRLPADVRTAMSVLHLEPEIRRTVCCPKCFTTYSLTDLPEICLHRETPRSRPCQEQLQAKRSTRGGVRLVPRMLYSTQVFDSWLEYFLSRPEVEDLIELSYNHTPNPRNMQSVYDSPAWRSLGDDGTFSITRGNLTFSYYIDWFNPFYNKTAGKTISCGAIMMFCLNLPHDQQHLAENTYFAGITPPPKEPTVTTITHLADPIIDSLKPWWEGRIVRTYKHPDGAWIRIAVLARIADLNASKKALGFAGTASKKNFCSFCKLALADRDDLNYQAWEMRTGEEVLALAIAWKDADTHVEKDDLVRSHGIRWSSLHALPYGDPVQHTMLGIMHNWLEGVLQHHVRVLWGVGFPDRKKKKKKARNSDEDSDLSQGDDNRAQKRRKTKRKLVRTTSQETNLTFSMETVSQDEMDSLYEESRRFNDVPLNTGSYLRSRRQSSMLLDSNASSGDEEEDIDYAPADDSDSELDSEDGDESDEEKWLPGCVFSREELKIIRSCLADAVVPSYLARPPANLGNKSHGKLKADQWLVLISVFLPLILPEIWSSGGQTNSRRPLDKLLLLENFDHLVMCTNILCSYLVPEWAPAAYQDSYIKYRQSAKSLFPRRRSTPNHHYAMHNPHLMRFWGPLTCISEFAGERHNGDLQDINTNNHLWELDYTMLRQMCRRGRLMGYLRSLAVTKSSSDLVVNGIEILLGQPRNKQDPSGVGLKIIPESIYRALLAYLNSNGTMQMRHAKDLPHPDGALVLPRAAIPIFHLSHKGRSYSTFDLHPGNSALSFHIQQERMGSDSGYIQSMWKFNNLHGDASGTRTFIVVSKHKGLSEADFARSPIASRPGLLAKIVYSADVSDASSFLIMEPKHVVGHVAFYLRPPGTYGIRKATTVLINSLHRYRK